jgi:Predicted nucleotide-binding protein containing TIR-like domain
MRKERCQRLSAGAFHPGHELSMITTSGKEERAARVVRASNAVRAGERVTSLLRDGGARFSPLREISTRARETPSPTLPVMATTGDVRELVRLLKKRRAGISIVEAMNSEQKRIFDPRKIAAYEFWGIVDRDGERIRLTPLGLEIARQLEPEAQLYRTVLDNIAPYRSVLEWVSQEGLSLVTHTDVAAYWQEQYTEAIAGPDEKTVEASVVCFFHLCQAAELGTATIGKRGQPARLHVERTELASYIQHRRRSGTVEMFSGDTLPVHDDPSANARESSEAAGRELKRATDGRRLLISHSKKPEIVEQIQLALSLADIESAVAEREGACAAGGEGGETGPVAEHILYAMRQCDAAIIIVAAEDCAEDQTGRPSLKEDVLVEIGAAFVFYDRRVVLLWDASVPVPSNLQNLSRCRFEGGKLTWETGVELLKAIKELQD